MSENTATPKRSLTPMDLGFMDVESLQRYVTDSGKIQPRRFSGLTQKQQRHVSRQIKRARQLLLMT
jgi:small subunit ribosomal protein S18